MNNRPHKHPRGLPLRLIIGAVALLSSAGTLAQTEAPALSGQVKTPPATTDQPLTEQQIQDVNKLQSILRAYYSAQESAIETTAPDPETLQHQKNDQEAERLARIPFSADKILLSGEEGNTVLAHFSRRIKDPRIPDSRRDVAPICSIKTRLFDTLVDSDQRSLKPVGKQHYIASVELQPGETRFNIKAETWHIEIPEHASTREYIITFYRPPGAKSQFHIFAAEDFYTAETPLLPDWLPPDIEEALSPQ